MLFLFFSFLFFFSSTLIHVRTAEVNSTWLDVVSDDAYMLIAVWARVFMPEADHVAQLMDHDAKLIAVLSYGDGLRAAASPPHIGATPTGGGENWLDPGAPAEQTLSLLLNIEGACQCL